MSASGIQPGYVDLAGLAVYTSMSVRWWRARLSELQVIRLPGKILIAVADADAYLAKFRQVAPDLSAAFAIAEELTSSRRRRAGRARQ